MDSILLTCGNFDAAENLILSYSQQPDCLEITECIEAPKWDVMRRDTTQQVLSEVEP